MAHTIVTLASTVLARCSLALNHNRIEGYMPN